MRNKSYAKELAGTVREILGTAFSVGCTVDGQSPQDISAKVASGVSLCLVALCAIYILTHTGQPKGNRNPICLRTLYNNLSAILCKDTYTLFSFFVSISTVSCSRQEMEYLSTVSCSRQEMEYKGNGKMEKHLYVF